MLDSPFKSAMGLTLVMLIVGAGGCASSPQPDCSMPSTHNLAAAFEATREKLSKGCEADFDHYMDGLLQIAEGSPDPANKRAFSDFLLWAQERGLLSTRQAQSIYNRYFNVKFMAMAGDYNTCSHTCPNKARVLREMEMELSDKERGLLRASEDAEGYYRADLLLQETELVLEATCLACEQDQ
jgi:hypothetical protein